METVAKFRCPRGRRLQARPGRAITAKWALSSTVGNSRQVEISAKASAPRMKKICNGVHPSACNTRSESAVYE